MGFFLGLDISLREVPAKDSCKNLRAKTSPDRHPLHVTVLFLQPLEAAGHPVSLKKLLVGFSSSLLFGGLLLFANTDDAWIQRAGQSMEGGVRSIVDQASHGMGIGTIELHCVERSLIRSKEPRIPPAIGKTAHF